MTVILDGKNLANKIIENLKNDTQELTKKPKLAVLLVGDNPASQIYVRNKQQEVATNVSFISKFKTYI